MFQDTRNADYGNFSGAVGGVSDGDQRAVGGDSVGDQRAKERKIADRVASYSSDRSTKTFACAASMVQAENLVKLVRVLFQEFLPR